MEKLGERIDVVGVFRDNGVRPLRIRWRKTVYPVERITGAWTFREGDHKEYHFSVIIPGGVILEICLDTRDMTWSLERFFQEA
jgi:hypothetical protein